MRIFFMTILLCAVMAIPAVADAQGGGLVTCALGNTYDCNWCTLVDMVNGLITFVISMLSVIAVIIMVIAGFKMVTSGGDQSAWESGKKMLTSVIIGIVLVLAAWLIIDTMLSMLTGRGINDWLPDDCGGELAARPATSGTGGTGGVTGTTGTLSGSQYSEAEARELLEDAGIGVNKVCGSGGTSGTCLQGIDKSVLDGVIAMKSDCPSCAVTFTGGTESGIHRSTCHASGTCADVNCNGGCSTSQIKALDAAARANGFRPVYEVKSSARRSELMNSGFSGEVIVVGHATAEHFSVYR